MSRWEQLSTHGVFFYCFQGPIGPVGPKGNQVTDIRIA